MKILIVAPQSGFTQDIKKAFEEKGAETFYLNERSNYLVPPFLREKHWLWNLTIRKSGFLKMRNKDLFNKKLIEIADQYKPDILFTTKGTTIRAATHQYLRSRGIKTVNWWFENINHPVYSKWLRQNYSNFSHFFSFDSGSLEVLRSTPNCSVSYLPFGINTESYQVTDISDQDKYRFGCDVCFVGARYPEREAILERVAKSGFNLKIFGWRDWASSSLSKFYHGPLNTVEMAKVFRTAKICLNSNLKPSSTSVNFKTFEIGAAGGFQLCDNQGDLAGLFKIGEEIEVYSDLNDMTRKIHFYLNNEQARNKIALAGQARVAKDHTLGQRIQTILNHISK